MRQFVVPTSFQARDQFSPAVDKMQQKVDRFAKKSEANIARLDRRFRQIGDSARKFGTSSLIFGTALLAPLGLAVNEAMKFEKAMSNISTLLDTNVENMDQMGKEVLKLASRLPVPVDELTASLYDIRSAGVAADKSMETLETSARLSAAGLSTTSEATNIMTSAINAFANENLSANDTANILFKTVQFGKTNIAELSQAFGANAAIIESAGVKLADFSAATAALTTVGTPAAQSQNQLRASVIALQKPSADMEKIFKKLGVTTGNELIEKFGTLGSSYAAINEQSQKLGLNNAKVWRSSEALAAVTSITGATNESYTKTLESMNDSTDSLSEAFDKQAATMSAQAQIAKNNISVLAITIGQKLLPVISNIFKKIQPVILKWIDWIQENDRLVSRIVKVIAIVGSLAVGIGVLSLAVSVATKAFAIVKGAIWLYNTALKGAAAAQKILNIVMAANPIGLLIAGFVALVAVVGTLISRYRSATTAQRALSDVQKRASELAMDQKIQVQNLFRQMKQLNPETQKYKDVLSKLNDIAPEIVDKYNLQEGAIRNLEAAEKDLIKQIEKRARVQAAQELMVAAQKDLIKMQQEGPGIMDKIIGTWFKIQTFGLGDIDTHGLKLAEQQQRVQALTNIVAADEMEEIKKSDLREQKTVTETNNNQKVQIELVGLPSWISANITGGGVSGNMPAVSTTNE